MFKNSVEFPVFTKRTNSHLGRLSVKSESVVEVAAGWIAVSPKGGVNGGWNVEVEESPCRNLAVAPVRSDKAAIADFVQNLWVILGSLVQPECARLVR